MFLMISAQLVNMFILIYSSYFSSLTCSLFYLFLFSGISGKSQILFAIVFASRYLDLFTSFISIYNTSMKVFFITTSLFTIYLMYFKFKATYDSNHDTFRVEFLVVPVGGLAFLVNHEFTPLEVRIILFKNEFNITLFKGVCE